MVLATIATDVAEEVAGNTYVRSAQREQSYEAAKKASSSKYRRPPKDSGWPRSILRHGAGKYFQLSFMPRDSIASPAAPKTASRQTPNTYGRSRLVLKRLRARPERQVIPSACREPHLLRCERNLEAAASLRLQTFTFARMKHRFSEDSVDRLRAEIIFVVETMYGLHQFVRRQIRELDLHHLVSTFVHHLRISGDEAVLHRVFVQFQLVPG